MQSIVAPLDGQTKGRKVLMKELVLDGLWELACVEDNKRALVNIPGSVYQNLLEAGVIEDPFYRDNEDRSRVVSEKNYEYKRLFHVEEDMLNQDKVYLICEGIDTIADVFINQKKVMQCNNMHMVLEVDVKADLVAGENEILISFTSPYKQIEIIKKNHPYMDLDRHLFQGKMQMRKAHYMFGWDWGPALADMGIYKSVFLRGYSDSRITDINVEQIHLFEKVKLSCSATWEAYSEGVEIKFSCYAPDGQLLFSKEADCGNAVFEIVNPELWWCINYGKQPLYTIKAEAILNGKVIHTFRKHIGLRTLTVCQDNDEFGQKFHFKINGVEVFAKGGDYIPEDSFLGRMSFDKSKKVIDSCIKANFNMIRIWGGGVYPTEAFLNYCDEQGVMVWQDFMFANIVTIWEGEEKETMIKEILQITHRMRNHPCIAILCGNNETELMVYDSMEPKYKEMYIKQYEVDMKEIVNKEAPHIFYWPSSPSSTGSMRDVENMSIGDTHDWNVWHGKKPFTYFRSTFPRFNSEFGLQSFPCMKTIETFTRPEDRNIFSYVMEGHQKSLSGNEYINYYIAQYFKFPTNFEALIYLSQAIQLEGIRYGVEHWRRNRNDQHCMGALFWQVNDCWPVASWASIDYFGRWKALHYGAKRFFEPILVSACEEGNIVELHVTNETLIETTGNLEWKLCHADQGVIKEESIACKIDRLHSDCITRLDFSDILGTKEDKRSYYLVYSYQSEGKALGLGTVMFTPAKHFNFRKPHILCQKIDDRKYQLIADQFCKFVEVKFDDDVILSDNYFDLVPGMEKIIETEEAVAGEPKIYSLFDSFS
jgi:beta-mannosidase